MKNMLKLLLISLIICFLSACGKSIPTTNEILANDAYAYEFTDNITLKDLTKAWGEPYDFRNGNTIWKVNDKYISVVFDNDYAYAAHSSHTLRATIIEENEGTFIICPCEGQWELNSSDKIFFSPQWLPDGAVVSVGTTLIIEYNGMIMETYPAQIYEPFSVVVE